VASQVGGQPLSGSRSVGHHEDMGAVHAPVHAWPAPGMLSGLLGPTVALGSGWQWHASTHTVPSKGHKAVPLERVIVAVLFRGVVV